MKKSIQGTAHLLSRNILSTAAILSLMGITAFAAAPAGGYAPGATLDPDCTPGDTDCSVVFTQEANKFVDGTTATDAVFTGGNVAIGTNAPWGDKLHVDGQNNGKTRVYVNNMDQGADAYGAFAIQTYGNNFELKNYSDSSIKPNVTEFKSTATGSKFLFSPNSITSMTLNENGNVGIGTTNPSVKLHINNDDRSSGSNVMAVTKSYDSSGVSREAILRIGGNTLDTSDKAFDIKTISSDTWYNKPSLHITRTDNVNKNDLVIDNLGNVGIGTITPDTELMIADAFDPVIKLIDTSLNGNTASLYTSGNGQGGGLLFNSDLAGQTLDPTGVGGTVFSITNNAYLTKAGILDFDGNVGRFTFGISDTTATEGNVVNYNKHMTIENNGNVGIGTTAPDVKLEVDGDIQINGMTSTKSPSITFNTTLDTEIAPTKTQVVNKKDLIHVTVEGAAAGIYIHLITNIPSGNNFKSTAFDIVYVSKNAGTIGTLLSSDNEDNFYYYGINESDFEIETYGHSSGFRAIRLKQVAGTIFRASLRVSGSKGRIGAGIEDLEITGGELSALSTL